jgi:hypothetical protein
MDFSSILGVDFSRNVLADQPEVEVVDTGHWVVAGIKPKFKLENTFKITSVTNSYETALTANLNVGEDTYPGLIGNDQPGSWGSVVYFAYPPEETMEILLPIVERLRY